jgi:RNA polymerase sigma factor (sigma-70 family)
MARGLCPRLRPTKVFGQQRNSLKILWSVRQGLTGDLRPTITMRMETGDEALALAAANGDGQAFGLLLERHYDRLFGLCFRLTGTRAEAEDLTQDICAALPAKLSGYKAEAKVTTWLYRVAVNAAHDRRRRRATYMKATEGWGDWELARVDVAESKRDRLDWLTTAMQRLPDDLRDTLALVLDDLNHARVADILGISEGTVSWRMSEAKKKLRAIRAEEEAR